MPDYTQYWFTPASQTQPVPEFFYVSDCTLDFTYSAVVKDGSGVFVPIESIGEISFNPDMRTFSMAKCDPYDSVALANDSDCGGDAYFYSYEVAVVATLNDGVGTFNDELRFTVTFGPDCS